MQDIENELLNGHHKSLIRACFSHEPLITAIVHPVDEGCMKAIAEAAQEKLIDPVLIGPSERVALAAQKAGVDISKWKLIATAHSHAAAQKAVELAANRQVQAIMKGSLHTDELLHAVVRCQELRTEKRVSHVYLLETEAYHKPFIVTDAAINILPTLEEKADICQNAIDLWRVLYGLERKPKLAILSAIETINSHIPSTIDAASLCKMAERGQLTHVIIDGPLAFDNAISMQAAKEKHINSMVAGDADIFLVPNIEAGNILSKELIYWGKAAAAGICLGARVPIILTSRTDTSLTRLASCALAVKLAAAREAELIK